MADTDRIAACNTVFTSEILRHDTAAAIASRSASPTAESDHARIENNLKERDAEKELIADLEKKQQQNQQRIAELEQKDQHNQSTIDRIKKEALSRIETLKGEVHDLVNVAKARSGHAPNSHAPTDNSRDGLPGGDGSGPGRRIRDSSSSSNQVVLQSSAHPLALTAFGSLIAGAVNPSRTSIKIPSPHATTELPKRTLEDRFATLSTPVSIPRGRSAPRTVVPGVPSMPTPSDFPNPKKRSAAQMASPEEPTLVQNASRFPVCIYCYQRNLRCDSGRSCEHCTQANRKCVRAKCKYYKAGTCRVANCTRAHEEDEARYGLRGLVNAGPVAKEEKGLEEQTSHGFKRKKPRGKRAGRGKRI